jgi:hypothetical protein
VRTGLVNRWNKIRRGAVMTLGSRSRRVASGLSILMLVALLSGCHAMPLSRLEDNGPNRPQSLASASRATLLPATVAMDPPSEMSSFEPVLASPANLTSAAANASAPTPLLDAALQKARALDEPPTPEPVSQNQAPAEPQSPPPSSLFSAPLSIELPPPRPKADPTAQTSNTPSAETPAKKEPEPPRLEDLWSEGVQKLNSVARARLEQAGGSATPWALRARVLSWLAEPDIDPDIDQHDAQGVRAVLKALDEPTGEVNRKGSAVRSAVLVLEDKAPLEIVDLKLCSRVEKFGDFEPFDPPVRKTGQRVILYCEIDGLKFEQTAAGFRTRMAGQVEIVPEAGGPAVFSRSLNLAEETCRRRRRDYYIAYVLELPPSLTPGDYRIRLTEKDLTSDRTATREVSLVIVKD